MSTTLPSLDVVFSIETYRFSVAARDGDDIRILILQRLKQRLGRSPEAVVVGIMVGGNVNVGLVGPYMLERLLNRESIQERCGNRYQRDIHASDSFHCCFLVIRDSSAAVAVHNPKPIVESNQISNRTFRHYTRIARTTLTNGSALLRLLRRGRACETFNALSNASVTSFGGSP